MCVQKKRNVDCLSRIPNVIVTQKKHFLICTGWSLDWGFRYLFSSSCIQDIVARALIGLAAACAREQKYLAYNLFSCIFC